jgi:hypothetical protein
MPLKTFVHPVGIRVRIRRGRFPMDPAQIGKTGLIVEVDDYRPMHYGVTLDGETGLRDFLEDEIEPLPEERDPRGVDAGGMSPKDTLRSPG